MRATGLRSDTPRSILSGLEFSATSDLARETAQELGLDPYVGAIEVAERNGWRYVRGTLLKPEEWRYLCDQALSAGFRSLGGRAGNGYVRAEGVAAKAAQARRDAKEAASPDGQYRAMVQAENEAAHRAWVASLPEDERAGWTNAN